MVTIRQDLRNALQGTFTKVSLIVSAISLTSGIVRLFELRTSEVLLILLEYFRAIFHWPIQIVLGLFSIKMPAVYYDIIVAYLAFGGATARTELKLVRVHTGPNVISVVSSKFRVGIAKSRTKKFLYGVVVSLIWPYFLAKNFYRPIVHEYDHQGDVIFPVQHRTHDDWENWFERDGVGGVGNFGVILMNLRRVFLIQRVALGLSSVLILLVNAVPSL